MKRDDNRQLPDDFTDRLLAILYEDPKRIGSADRNGWPSQHVELARAAAGLLPVRNQVAGRHRFGRGRIRKIVAEALSLAAAVGAVLSEAARRAGRGVTFRLRRLWTEHRKTRGATPCSFATT